MEKLDPQKCLVYGASSHKYAMNPVVNDKPILEFERKNNIELPISYRSYLQHFGDSGAAEFNGTLSFLNDVSHRDMSSPSPMPIFEGTHDCGTETDDFKIDLLQCEDGRVEIARGFNPSTPYLVLNGDASGQVYWWNYGDMCGALGDFARWYHNWANRVVNRLRFHHKVNAFPIGSSTLELEEAFPGLVHVWTHSSGERRVNVGETALYFTLDTRDRLTSCLVSGHMRDS